jgi:hypothetical protein
MIAAFERFIGPLRRFLNRPLVFRCIAAFYLAWLVLGVVLIVIAFWGVAHL